MSERYEKEIRLRLLGDKVECQKYIARARTLLGELYNRDVSIGGNDQAWRQVTLPNGVVITAHYNTYMPVLEINVPPSTPPIDIIPPIFEFRMAWVPEGIVLSPVSEEFPEGYGTLPTRSSKFVPGVNPNDPDILAGEILNPQPEIDPELEHETLQASPYGTEDGIWRQVLLNRYPNNKYLDRKDFIAVDEFFTRNIVEPNPRLRENITVGYSYEGKSRCEHWPRLYNPMPIENEGINEAINFWTTTVGQVPGIYNTAGPTLTLEVPQFAAGSHNQQIVTENETDQWYCHRPGLGVSR